MYSVFMSVYECECTSIIYSLFINLLAINRFSICTYAEIQFVFGPIINSYICTQPNESEHLSSFILSSFLARKTRKIKTLLIFSQKFYSNFYFKISITFALNGCPIPVKNSIDFIFYSIPLCVCYTRPILKKKNRFQNGTADVIYEFIYSVLCSWFQSVLQNIHIAKVVLLFISDLEQYEKQSKHL